MHTDPAEATFLIVMLFWTHAQIDPFDSRGGCTFAQIAAANGLAVPAQLGDDDRRLARSGAPRAGHAPVGQTERSGRFSIDYPDSQAALAESPQRVRTPVAERFELFYRGIELANGYHELCDPQRNFGTTHRGRANGQRVAQGKAVPPTESADWRPRCGRGLPPRCRRSARLRSAGPASRRQKRTSAEVMAFTVRSCISDSFNSPEDGCRSSIEGFKCKTKSTLFIGL